MDRYPPHGPKTGLSGANAPVSDSEPAPDPATEPDPRERLVRRLWEASGPVPEAGPGRAYLAGRWAWPPADVDGAPELPLSVRWLAGESCRQPDRAAKRHGLPAGACGTLVFAWRPMAPQEPAPGALHSTAHFDPLPAALSLLAVSAGGERVTWFGRGVKVRAVGSRSGAVFEVRPGSEEEEPVHVSEGEVDVLALSLAPWTGPGRIVAAGGTAGMKRAAELPGAGPVTLHCDGDTGGRAAAGEAQARIQATGRECRIAWYVGDPADALSEWLIERAALRFEAQAGEGNPAGPWNDLMRGRENG